MAKIDQEYIDKLKAKFQELDNARDEIINTSIKVTRLSKQVIYSVIRDDFESAEKYIKEMKELVEKLKEMIKKYPMYLNNAVGIQEYAEAMILYYYLKENRIPTHEELGVDEISYVNGLMDFCGELLRKSTEEMIKGNIDFALKAKETIEEIYLKMLYMEFKNYELRRKVDYVSNVLNKLLEFIFYKTLRK